MLMTLQINSAQLAALRKRFGALGSLAWLRRPIRDSLWYMISSIHKNFEVEGRPTRWKAWTPLYQEFRERPGLYPMKILLLFGKTGSRVFSGQLRQSVSVGKIKIWGWIITTNLSYASVQQKGGSVGLHGAVLPPRPFLLFQAQDILLIRRMFNRHVTKLIS